MADMTTAEAAEILERAKKQGGTYGFVSEFSDACNLAAPICRRVASGELTEMGHGRWKCSDEKVELICSQCGCRMPFVRELAGKDLPYCPSCGALMDGKDGVPDA